MVKEYRSLRPMSGIEERGKEIVFMTIKTNSKKEKRGKGSGTLEATGVRMR